MNCKLSTQYRSAMCSSRGICVIFCTMAILIVSSMEENPPITDPEHNETPPSSAPQPDGYVDTGICKFPFVYKNQTFTTCTSVDSPSGQNRSWCALTSEFLGPWTFCDPVNYGDCVFPFTYNGASYNQCTTVDSPSGRPWCSINAEFKPHQWIYCGPQEGDCVFPFTYMGKMYDTCIRLGSPTWEPWCSLVPHHVIGLWKYCNSSDYPVSSHCRPMPPRPPPPVGVASHPCPLGQVRFLSPKLGRYIPGANIRQLKSVTPDKCQEACWLEPLCQSADYIALPPLYSYSYTRNGDCFLNDRKVGDVQGMQQTQLLTFECCYK